MDLLNIKDMELFFTEIKSKITDQQNGTGKHSAELKSTSFKTKDFIQRGLLCERIVEKDLVKNNWVVLSKRIKLKYGEVDLVAIKNHEIKLVEVKSLHDSWMIFERYKLKQQSRLILNQVWVQSMMKKMNVTCEVAFVDKHGKIDFVSLY